MKQSDFLDHVSNIKEHLSSELAQLRTGRAAASLVEDIKVSAYEGVAPLPLNEVASISTTDSQTILINPWDKSVLASIESAITESGRGLNPVNDGDNIRVNIPPLTEDRRKEMVKQISQVVEEGKIKVRNLRQNAIKAIEEQEDNGVISEDDMFREKKRIEEDVKKANDDLEDMAKQKESEVMQV